MRRKRGRRGNLSKKIGVLCLALLLGMGSLALGYAAWTAPLAISTMVNTGSWEVGGTPGFWKNSGSHNTYSQDDIERWLVAINGDSDWLGPTTVENMEAVFDTGEPDGAPMEQKFLRQYLATRLNVAAGRLFPGTTHLFSSYDPGDYLELGGQDTLLAIIDAIESRHPDPGADPPTEAQFEIMKDICDALNNLLI